MLALLIAAELHKLQSTELPLPRSLLASIQLEGLITRLLQLYKQLNVSTNVLLRGCNRAIDLSLL